MKGTVLCVFIIISITQAFILDTINGGHLLGHCTTDTDCLNGCCIAMKNPFALFSHMECRPYHLPGAPCDPAVAGMGMDCGCMPGYTCQGPDLGSVALEPSAHVKGSCMPASGGSVTGPQIAVEGGR